MKRHRRPEKNGPGTLRFILIATFFMMCSYLFDLPFIGTKPLVPFPQKHSLEETALTHDNKQLVQPPVRVHPPDGRDYFELRDPVKKNEQHTDFSGIENIKGRIALVIDDMGIDTRRTQQAIVLLPESVTFAFLPYAPQTAKLASIARREGHPLLIHLPMESNHPSQDEGPLSLTVGMDDPSFVQTFKTILESFVGYEGVNNHMGSKMTANRPSMDRVMKVLKEQGLYFLDSRTTPQTTGPQAAEEKGVRFTQRDIFLDHENNSEFIASSLLQAERLAYRRGREGAVVMIGHPREETLKALEPWLRDLPSKNIALIPLRETLDNASQKPPPSQALQ